MTSDVDPDALAARVRPLLGHALIGFDVDGVLAPIVEHADDALLSPGIGQALARLARRAAVAIVSGRSLESLERLFAFDERLAVIGSHGLEVRGEPAVRLEGHEQDTFDRLERLGADAVAAAGEGAWLEYKPASIVVHTRLADPELAGPAVDALTRLAPTVDGSEVKPGHHVVELLARPTSKGDALMRIAFERHLAPIVYLGDDVTDEEAFALMGPDDVSVRVGDGDTLARWRLPDTAAVARFVAALG